MDQHYYVDISTLNFKNISLKIKKKNVTFIFQYFFFPSGEPVPVETLGNNKGCPDLYVRVESGTHPLFLTRIWLVYYLWRFLLGTLWSYTYFHNHHIDCMCLYVGQWINWSNSMNSRVILMHMKLLLVKVQVRTPLDIQ